MRVPNVAHLMAIDWYVVCLTGIVLAGSAVDAHLMAMLVGVSLVQPEVRCARNSRESQSPLEIGAHVMSSSYISKLV